VVKKWLVISMLLGIGQIAAASNEEPAFDWLRINPIYSFDTFDWTQLPAGISPEMVQGLLHHPISENQVPLTILPLDGQIFALTTCRFDVLLWSGSEWVNLYKGYAAGFNCRNDFFIRDGKLYSYGKYGFWQAHSEILNFNFKSGTWENLTARYLPPYYMGHAAFNAEFGLLSIMGGYVNQSSGLYQLENNGFYFDFEEQTWQKVAVGIPNTSEITLWMDASFDLQDFGVYLYRYQAEHGFLLFDKEDLGLMFKKVDYTPIQQASMTYAFKNEIWFFNESGPGVHYSFDEKGLISFKKVGEVKLLDAATEANPAKNDWRNPLLLLLSFVVLGLGGYVIVLRNKNKALPNLVPRPPKWEVGVEEDSNGDIDAIIGRLVPYANQFVTVDTLDELLGITHIDNPDYRKVKRSRLVKAINAVYKEKKKATLIERKRLSHDKRLVQYKIYGK
jgi:hypothetical protein